MKSIFSVLPEAASQIARDVDLLFVIWSAISLFFSVLIAVLIAYFMVKYRRRSEDQVGLEERPALWLEIAWSVIPLGICLVMFAWGAKVFFDIYRTPAGAVEFAVVGKQWMWKVQHPEGNREINALHVPVGQAVKLNLTSEDVLHSFFIPALRVKQDAIPGRYTSVWFRADKPGTYHLFCAEYCGAEHSRMIGTVTVLDRQGYEAWLVGGPSAGQSMAATGEQLFQSLGCVTCHVDAPGRPARAPQLAGLYGSAVELAGGSSVTADDTYLRESILNPAAKLVAGWTPLMNPYQGQVTEEQISQLIAYIRSLEKQAGPDALPSTASTAALSPLSVGTNQP
jgi:cytochrome c oxidase subunit 2